MEGLRLLEENRRRNCVVELAGRGGEGVRVGLRGLRGEVEVVRLGG